MTEIERLKNLEIEKINKIKQARFSRNYKYIIDHYGNSIKRYYGKNSND